MVNNDDGEYDGDDSAVSGVGHQLHPFSNSPQQGGGDAHSAKAHVFMQASKVNNDHLELEYCSSLPNVSVFASTEKLNFLA